MKKTLSTLILVIISIVSFAQVYLTPEDFSGEEFPPEGWIIENGGNESTFEPGPMPLTTEPTCAFITTSANMDIDDRLITPEITLPSGSTANIYAQLRGSVGYALAMYWDPDNEVRYFIEVSTDGGNSWTAVLDLDDQASVQAAGASFPWPDWDWFNVAIDISAYAGQTIMVAFHHEKEFVPSGGGSFGITNFGVLEVVENDVELTSMNMPNYALVNDNVEITGSFKNLGSNVVTSFEGEYRINGVVAGTFEAEGLSVSQFSNHNFVAGNPAVFDAVDIYEVELEITKVNGVDDNSPENNILEQAISIGSELVDRIPLFEVFTSSTCYTCPGANDLIDAILLDKPDDEYSLVKYHVDWPGNGDPYYIEATGVRADYYSVFGVPDLFTNGAYDNPFNFSNGVYNSAKNEEAFVNMSVSYVFDGLNVSATVDVDPKINIEDASVHMAIVEKTTYNNTGTNGETEFHNVIMAMMPDGNGTATALSDGVAVTFNGDVNMITTFIEEFDDLKIVAFVQDNLTKAILQSESHDLEITSDIENLKHMSVSIFPNPGNGIFTIKGVKDARLEVNSLNGQLIHEERFSSDTVVDLSSQEKGVYLLEIFSNEELIKVEKLIIQ